MLVGPQLRREPQIENCVPDLLQADIAACSASRKASWVKQPPFSSTAIADRFLMNIKSVVTHMSLRSLRGGSLNQRAAEVPALL